MGCQRGFACLDNGALSVVPPASSRSLLGVLLAPISTSPAFSNRITMQFISAFWLCDFFLIDVSRLERGRTCVERFACSRPGKPVEKVKPDACSITTGLFRGHLLGSSRQTACHIKGDHPRIIKTNRPTKETFELQCYRVDAGDEEDAGEAESSMPQAHTFHQ